MILSCVSLIFNLDHRKHLNALRYHYFLSEYTERNNYLKVIRRCYGNGTYLFSLVVSLCAKLSCHVM